MSNISDLPTEVLDYIFDYIKADDLRYAGRVCRQWNHLSSPRFFKTAKLVLEPIRFAFMPFDELSGNVGQGKLRCLEANDLLELMFTRSDLLYKATKTMVQLLEVSRFSLEEVRLRNCPEEILMAFYGGLKKQCRLRHLKVDVDPDHFREMFVPAVPRTVSESVGFAFVTHLKVTLGNESFVGLVSSLSRQLTCLTLKVFRKDLLLRCWNKLHLSALRSLTLIKGDPYMPIGVIRPEELGGECWRMLAQLETFRCGTYNLLAEVLVKMLQHCQKLQCLAISNGCISIECLEQIGAMKGLKDLELSLYGRFRGLGRDGLLLQLPNLENLHLSAEIGIRLGKQLPKINSIVLAGLEIHSCPKAILSEIVNIDGIGGRRLRKLPFVNVVLDHEANDWLGSLSIDLLSFEYCKIDGSLLDVLAKPDPRRKMLRIVMKDCTLIFQAEKPYSVRTVAELREKCPYLQIAHSGIHYK